ncbi:MAG TPA: ABC transporter permease [Thermodesulfobacteriota bacterium]
MTGRAAAVMGALGRRPSSLVGSVAVLVMLVVALAAPWLPIPGPNDLDVVNRLKAPGAGHWFGTDDLGRDVLSRVVYGARVSLLVGFLVSGFALVAGGLVGLVGGYYSRLDNVLMRLMDGFMAFPNIVLAILLMAMLGASVTGIVVALGITYAPRMARVVRSAVLVVREATYVESARAIGSTDRSIIARYVTPNCISPIVVQWTFIFAYAILGEASLSFLGIGVPPEVPTWGTILSEGRAYIGRALWMTLFPGLAIFWTVLGLNLLGDGVRDSLDPYMRKAVGL